MDLFFTASVSASIFKLKERLCNIWHTLGTIIGGQDCSCLWEYQYGEWRFWFWLWAIFIKRHYDVRIAFWIVAFFISLRLAILSETSILVKWLEMHVSREGWLVFCMNDYKCLSSRTNGITIGNLFLATVPARVGSRHKAERFPIFLANVMLVKFHICQQQQKCIINGNLANDISKKAQIPYH